MRQVGGGDVLGVYDGNAIKLACDDRCTTINVIKCIEKKKEQFQKQTNKQTLVIVWKN